MSHVSMPVTVLVASPGRTDGLAWNVECESERGFLRHDRTELLDHSFESKSGPFESKSDH
jgi:hypothetical protein